jgi:hypothetical protein
MVTTDEKPIKLPLGSYWRLLTVFKSRPSVGALIYAVCRLEPAFKTWDLQLSEVDEQLKLRRSERGVEWELTRFGGHP